MRFLIAALALFAASASAQVAGYKTTACINFPNPVAIPVGELMLNATSSANLPVIYESKTTSKCTVTGNVATLKAVGTCTLLAKTVATATFMAAQTPVSFNITAAVPPPPPIGWTVQQKYFAACGACPSTGKIETETCPNYKIGLIDQAKGEFSYNMKWTAL